MTDDNLKQLRTLEKRCKHLNIILNEDKKVVGLNEILFHGHKISKEGIKPDNTKIKAIINMPAPTNVSG